MVDFAKLINISWITICPALFPARNPRWPYSYVCILSEWIFSVSIRTFTSSGSPSLSLIPVYIWILEDSIFDKL